MQIRDYFDGRFFWWLSNVFQIHEQWFNKFKNLIDIDGYAWYCLQRTL
jgi:hypothetical protein